MRATVRNFARTPTHPYHKHRHVTVGVRAMLRTFARILGIGFSLGNLHWQFALAFSTGNLHLHFLSMFVLELSTGSVRWHFVLAISIGNLYWHLVLAMCTGI